MIGLLLALLLTAVEPAPQFPQPVEAEDWSPGGGLVLVHGWPALVWWKR